uniref:Esterase lipase n=1 Tax=uncultured microorganism TaxID=358574 RepID=A0A0B4ZRX1_9ZZZZ|nr:esterase lipase [uncultured microorganism]
MIEIVVLFDRNIISTQTYMEQEIRFCRASDGVRIAYGITGEGPPLVKAANYLTHLEHDYNGPVWKHWIKGLSVNHTYIRYDARGCGLSDREIDEYSIDAWVRDLEAVVDELNLMRFPLLGISQGASVCVAYAARYPERVSHLILYGGYTRGRFNRNLTPDQRTEAETMINIIRTGWGQENPAFRQLFSMLLMPGGTKQQIDWLNELAQISTSPESAANMERAFYHIDVTHEAGKVSVPTLVLHAKNDSCIAFEEGRILASYIPDARFVTLNSPNHILLEDEPAWERFLEEVQNFISTDNGNSAEENLKQAFPELTPREIDVLELISRGYKNSEIAEELYISPKTVRNHINHIFSKLQVDSRGKAIVLAREAGMGKA